MEQIHEVHELIGNLSSTIKNHKLYDLHNIGHNNGSEVWNNYGEDVTLALDMILVIISVKIW